MRIALLAAALLIAAAPCLAAAPPLPHPDLSGFWNLDLKVPRDPQLMSQVAPDTVFIDDTGPAELPRGNYGGLKLTPAAQDKANHWGTANTADAGERLPSAFDCLCVAGTLSDRSLPKRQVHRDEARIL